jgi:hypothetical protein
MEVTHPFSAYEPTSNSKPFNEPEGFGDAWDKKKIALGFLAKLREVRATRGPFTRR